MMSKARVKAKQGADVEGSGFIFDGVATIEVGIAMATFGSFMVAYHSLMEYAIPANIMFIFMVAALVLGYVWGVYKLSYTRLNIAGFTTGLLATAGVFMLNWVITAFTALPASGLVAEVSPFYIMLFYASVGVAEECLFTVLLFGLMVKYGAHPVLALVAKSLLFVAYHNQVAITLFGQQIFKVTHYALLLYFGSVLFTAVYYWTKYASTAITGHALVNAFVMAVNIGVLTT